MNNEKDYGIYLVTDPVLCGIRGVVETVRLAVDGGVRTVQLRDKHASFDQQLNQLDQLADVIDGRAKLVINDRLDVAVEAQKRGIAIDGVHLGQGDEAVLTAREQLGADALIGLTANTEEHLAAVAALPAGTVDYVGVGVIRPTSTKPDHPPALGTAGFQHLTAISPVPTVAIGGVGEDDLAGLRAAGAAGVCFVSVLCAADDPAAVARRFGQLWAN
ncbi:MAG: thiamine phosphate synthase [Corynebacterium casei]|nr:thiamine phosphate synthase [Corynebacterium casei]